jgi:CBS domain-containing protein
MERTIFQAMSQRHVISHGPAATCFDAACSMTRDRCTSVLVIDAGNKLQGIVTERDMVTRVMARGLDPTRTALQQVMTPDPRCVPPTMQVADAVLIMIERGFRHLPVVDVGGRILGVFSVRDALPREVGAAVSLAEFHQQLNDAKV